MSIQASYIGGVEKPFPVPLTTTAVTAVRVASNNNGIIAGFAAVNNSGSVVLLTCYYYDSEATTQYDIFQRTIPANDTLIITDLPVRLYDADEFRVQVDTANVVTITPAVVTSHQNAPVS